MTDPLDRVIDAALERALVDGADARRYFALAGALERVRPGEESVSPALSDLEAPTGEEPRGEPDWRPEGGSSTGDRSDTDSGSREIDPLGAALVSTVAVRALESTRAPSVTSDAWSPGGGGSQTELVATGALAAYRRFDVTVDHVAARAGISPAELRRYSGVCD